MAINLNRSKEFEKLLKKIFGAIHEAGVRRIGKNKELRECNSEPTI